jgi:hypothetical protein
LPIEGTWIVNYASRAPGSFTDVNDEQEKAIIELENGRVTGHDSRGGKYEGTYLLTQAKLQMSLTITTEGVGTRGIFGLAFPFHLNLRGHYSRPDFLSLRDQSLGHAVEVVLNCRRQRKKIKDR